MKTSAFVLALVLGAAFFAPDARADGEELNVHNNTGHEVVVFLLQGDSEDLDPDDGVQAAHLENGASAVAHVPNCQFEVLLVDNEDVWHAAMHDCSATDLTFNSDTGHAHRQHHH